MISSFLGEAGLKSRTSHRRQDIFTGDGVDLGEVSGPAMALLKVAGTCSPPVKLHGDLWSILKLFHDINGGFQSKLEMIG